MSNIVKNIQCALTQDQLTAAIMKFIEDEELITEAITEIEEIEPKAHFIVKKTKRREYRNADQHTISIMTNYDKPLFNELLEEREALRNKYTFIDKHIILIPVVNSHFFWELLVFKFAGNDQTLSIHNGRQEAIPLDDYKDGKSITQPANGQSILNIIASYFGDNYKLEGIKDLRETDISSKKKDLKKKVSELGDGLIAKLLTMYDDKKVEINELILGLFFNEWFGLNRLYKLTSEQYDILIQQVEKSLKEYIIEYKSKELKDKREDKGQLISEEELGIAQFYKNNFTITNLNDKKYWVDKTYFIEAIMERVVGNVVAYIRPEGYGKTINLLCLKSYIQPLLNKSLKDARDQLFEGSRIFKYRPELMGKIPVIYLDFKIYNDNMLNLSRTIYKNILNLYKFELRYLQIQELENIINTEDNYSKFIYIDFNSNSTDLKRIQDQYALFQIADHKMKALNETFDKDPVAQISKILCLLSDTLTKHHSKKPYLIIDHYDYLFKQKLIQKYCSGDNFTTSFHESYDFFNSMLLNITKCNFERVIFAGQNSILLRSSLPDVVYKTLDDYYILAII
jgi:hypothetical protein